VPGPVTPVGISSRWDAADGCALARKREKHRVDNIESYNDNKYWVEDSDALTKAEKVQFAKDLLELGDRAPFEYRDGLWRLADGVEIEETPDGPVARFRNKEDGKN